MCLMVHPLFLGTDYTDFFGQSPQQHVTVSSPNVFVVVPTDAITRTFRVIQLAEGLKPEDGFRVNPYNPCL